LDFFRTAAPTTFGASPKQAPRTPLRVNRCGMKGGRPIITLPASYEGRPPATDRGSSRFPGCCSRTIPEAHLSAGGGIVWLVFARLRFVSLGSATRPWARASRRPTAKRRSAASTMAWIVVGVALLPPPQQLEDLVSVEVAADQGGSRREQAVQHAQVAVQDLCCTRTKMAPLGTLEFPVSL
jgi:hypothetical protein